MTLPKMLRVEQRFDHPAVADPAAAAGRALGNALEDGDDLAGKSIAVTAGSRGIANIVPLVGGLVTALRQSGADPFLVPSMGSHGGGTANGQVQVLESLGITERSVGAPIRASMDTVRIAETDDGFPVLLDRLAYEADGIVVANRVKPHTEFPGKYQSGLLKMMLIGLGNHAGAINYHRAATRVPFEDLLVATGRLVLDRAPIVAGIAILENGREETADVVGMKPSQFFDLEPGLLERAAELMPRVPFDDIDLLIIDEMGKNVSGAGMDTNVIRRKHWADMSTGEQADPGGPKRVFVRDLTDESRGNAAGIGLADFALGRLADKIDRHKTYTNTITATRPRGAMLPLVYDTDREAVEQALLSVGIDDGSLARVARIRNTLQLVEFEVSEPLLQHASAGADVATVSDGVGLEYDSHGMLTPDRIV